MPNLFRRLLDPIGLAVFGAGAVTTALTGEYWLMPLAVAGWSLIALGRTPPPTAENSKVKEPAPARGLTGPLAEIELRLARRAQKIARAVEEATPTVQGCVGELPGLANALVDKCRALLLKLSAVDVFLAESESEDPERELERSRVAEAGAKDEVVRQRWSQVRAAAEARLAEFEQIKTNRARMAAELAEAEARLKHVHTRILSLDSRDEESLTGLAGELRSVLGDLTQQIAVADRVLPDVSTSAGEESEGRRRLTQ